MALRLLSSLCGYCYQEIAHNLSVKGGVVKGKVVRKLSHGEKGQPFSAETTTLVAWVLTMALLGQEAQCPEVCYGKAPHV